MNAPAAAHPVKPFLSVVLVIATLMGIVFLQMEERRRGYVLLKSRQEQKRLLQEKRDREIQFAKITRPQLLEAMAQRRFTLRKVEASQIIHLSSGASPERSGE